MGIVKAISISKKKGVRKENVDEAILKEGSGIVGDAHAGTSRQLSLLAEESIAKMRDKGLKVGPGDFAENITTEGIDLLSLRIGDRLGIGSEAVLEITQKGKECLTRCSIYYRTGDCVMPREGIFAKVKVSGTIRPGDEIAVL
ncbi:MAG: MOSC domain-containing protein [Candidatus Omnitrophica bacterium]|nr:MOSC domain-containing protein [Candidatus Omnitrophota bacterium]